MSENIDAVEELVLVKKMHPELVEPCVTLNIKRRNCESDFPVLKTFLFISVLITCISEKWCKFCRNLQHLRKSDGNKSGCKYN